MSQAAPLLRQIKTIFNNQGITNDVQIASHLAFLLLVREKWEEIYQAHPSDISDLLDRWYHELEEQLPTTTTLTSAHLPQPPNRKFHKNSLHHIIDITRMLERSLKDSPYKNVAAFFQHEIRFEILKDVRRESYPTPHHVADFIASLGVTSSEQQLIIFDPAAGTSGLLAAALRYAPTATLIGCDFDPNIAELGLANLLLHQSTKMEFYQESALTVVEQIDSVSFNYPADLFRSSVRTQEKRRFENYFDCVIMNPPFGGSRSDFEASQLHAVLQNNFGRSVHTLLAAVALFTLKPGGHAAILLPTGALFGRGGDERLRETLLRNHSLEAVVTLSKELFQPYSSVPAHLVIAQKNLGSEQSNNNLVWFSDVASDGYPPGAGRDLTAYQESTSNELPRIRDLVLRTRTADWDIALTLAKDTQLYGLLLQPEDGLHGIGLLSNGPLPIQWQVNALPSGALIAVKQEVGENDDQSILLARLYLPYQAQTIVVLSHEQAEEVSWEVAIPAENWSQALLDVGNQTWNGDTDTITAKIENVAVLEIKSGTGRSSQSYHFQQTEPILSGLLACIISEAGTSITPWLSLVESQSTDDLKADGFAEKFSASPLLDVNERRCGWLIKLTVLPESGDEATFNGTLLIVYDQSAFLYRTPVPSERIALLHSGWMRISPNSQVNIEVGDAVRLRDEFSQAGFAVGAVAPGSSDSYRVFGTAVLKDRLLSTLANGTVQVESFEPRRFLPEPLSVPIGRPSTIIANIRKNQVQLGMQIDLLLNLVGSTTKQRQSSDKVENVHPLVHLLEAKQQRFWQQLQTQANATADTFYFTDDDLPSYLSTVDYSADFVRQQIELFLRMGLLEAVHMGERNLYRLSAIARGEPST